MSGREAFARDLKAARRAAGITQRELAAILRVDVGAVSGWERGIRMPGKHNRRAVIEFLASTAPFADMTLVEYVSRYELSDETDNASAPHSENVRPQAEQVRGFSDEDRALIRQLLQRLERLQRLAENG